MNPLAAPNNSNNSTYIKGMNAAGRISGYYFDGGAIRSVTENGGTFATTSFNLPVTLPPGYYSLSLSGVNDSGDVVGEYLGIYRDQAFVEEGGVFMTLAEPSSPSSLNGINNAGQFVGHNFASGPAAGILASPIPEPSTLVVAFSATLISLFKSRGSRRTEREPRRLFN